MLSVSLYTFGCKINQLESEAIAHAFSLRGFRVLPWNGAAGEDVDILVFNTCTVTSKAEQKARRVIRKALRDHPQAVLMVTGCYAQMAREVLEALGQERGLASLDANRLVVVSGDAKSLFLDLPGFLAQTMPHELTLVLLSQWLREKETLKTFATERFRFSPGDFFLHSRASLKIQDGCDNHCSYCRVRLARGRSVSLEADQIRATLQALEAKGYGEAVLTGVNITQYRDTGIHREGVLHLGGLLSYLLAGTERIRLRLSSLEPEGLTEELLAVLGHPRIRPHFHLSLQSGSPRILEQMGRRYTPQDVERGIRCLRELKDDPFLGCDIITGFPGETEEAFEETFTLCRRSGFAWIHAFPYSPRPGTAAYTYAGTVSERDAVLRAARLGALSRAGRQTYSRGWLGREVEAILEASKECKSPFVTAVSDNYLKLLVQFPDQAPPPRGSAIRCKICGLPNRGADFSRFDALGEYLPDESVLSPGNPGCEKNPVNTENIRSSLSITRYPLEPV
ncbi:MAG: tRNA (N(6)-L-threonylcarbamoyladenosine(37)-C(2))-methylthiotransferase MtaB [Treponema sp.]|jgi:threonylcarbamoyladenosine tRNA methylthiotransferase MtaB|nr:tRNA (N(6)-L-threonylcarbamoyladenosine(37)-C(2))-methylthiotransferase MtaB [Treponema sp.]